MLFYDHFFFREAGSFYKLNKLIAKGFIEYLILHENVKLKTSHWNRKSNKNFVIKESKKTSLSYSLDKSTDKLKRLEMITFLFKIKESNFIKVVRR